ncbi:class I SAM-dependent methyltransferase [Lichenibacterium dinghuense]|uniref:class I SAM-dependent methyltransferase n=1 Tax=Lichenibacterium dinghuense TaxID=2895977 RepID=UPI001F1FAF1F|nr:class I SAM-dependent methyltransferase [Lichenibacterium sp. 6Y81]
MRPEDVARAWELNAPAWTEQARRGLDVYRDALNTPAFLALLPDVSGLDGLDIGCGEGSNTRALARRGAHMRAVDVAPTFVRAAREAEAAEPLGILYGEGDALALAFADGAFDFATAFMSLMDVPDPALALREAARVLKPGGFLQFSILHPCFVPPHRRVLREPDGNVRAVEVARYFDRVDGAEDVWWFTALPKAERGGVAPFRVPRFHRTLGDWVAMVVGAGLAIEALGEPCPSADLARAVPIVADAAVAPLFLHVRARRPAA